MSLFNYSTLKVNLNRTNHSLDIKILKSETGSYLNSEILFELESIFAWASNKLEISSLILSSEEEKFFQGLDELSFAGNPDKLEKMLKRIRKFTNAVALMPQTTICDLGEGASNIGLEISLFFDLRIGHKIGESSFNHLMLGLTPSVGGMGRLSEFVGKAKAKNWVLTHHKIDSSELFQSGLLLKVYDDTSRLSVVQNLSNKIDEQSPVARIQSKMAFQQLIESQMEMAQKIETKISLANLLSFDWFHAIKAKKEGAKASFMPAKSFSYSLNRAKDELVEELKP